MKRHRDLRIAQWEARASRVLCRASRLAHPAPVASLFSAGIRTNEPVGVGATLTRAVAPAAVWRVPRRTEGVRAFHGGGCNRRLANGEDAVRCPRGGSLPIKSTANHAT